MLFWTQYTGGTNEYTIVGEFSRTQLYPSPDGSLSRYLGRNCIARTRPVIGLHSPDVIENYIDDRFTKDLSQGVKSLFWRHSAGEIKAGAQMVVYGVKA